MKRKLISFVTLLATALLSVFCLVACSDNVEPVVITVSQEDLKKNNLPSITSSKITAEQARTIAQIIYHLLEADATEEDTDNVA